MLPAFLATGVGQIKALSAAEVPAPGVAGTAFPTRRPHAHPGVDHRAKEPPAHPAKMRGAVVVNSTVQRFGLHLAGPIPLPRVAQGQETAQLGSRGCQLRSRRRTFWPFA